MNEKFNKNAKVEQLTNMFLSRGEEKGLIVKDPFHRILGPRVSFQLPVGTEEDQGQVVDCWDIYKTLHSDRKILC